MRRGAVIAVAVTLLVATAVNVVGSDDAGYNVVLQLENAGGLRDGSPVVVGGVQVGQARLKATQDEVEVEVRVDEDHAPLGKDATASIVAQNLLGQKQVSLDLGDADRPAPSGYRLPTDQVSTTTDLDQLLSTLDPDTRTRLGILLNEAGTAFVGRKTDLRELLVHLGPALGHGGDLLARLTRENRSLVNLLDHSDSYIEKLAQERRTLSQTVDLLGRTTENVAAKRAALRTTLERSPQALATARTFLGELRSTVEPLTGATRGLQKSAAPLRSVLDELGPFQKAARPALAAVPSVAPALTNLAKKGTPRLRRTQPLLRSLAAAGETELPPVGRTLERSMDNLLAVVDNWAHAIQLRDRMGHVFRGEATIAPDALASAVGRLSRLFPPAKHDDLAKRKPGRATAPKPSPAPAPGSGAPERTPQIPNPPLSELEDALEGLLPTGGKDDDAPSSDLEPLLDFLLK